MDVMVLAPLAAFTGVCLVVFGVYRIVNHPGVLARQQLADFVGPVRGGAAGRLLAAGSLIRRRQFSDIPGLDRLLRQSGRGSRLSMELARAGMKLSPGEYLLIRFSAGTVLALVAYKATSAPLIAAGALAAGWFLPFLYVRRRAATRTRLFDEQLVNALTLLSNALKSGYSFLQGMESAAREMPDPLGSEFEVALGELRIGASVEDALGQMAARVRSKEFELVCTALSVQRQVGGNLTEILTHLSQTIRQRHRLVREVRVLTAEQRVSGYVVAALPFVLSLGLFLINPGYQLGFWNDPAGRTMLGVGLVLELLGLAIIRRLMVIEV